MLRYATALVPRRARYSTILYAIPDKARYLPTSQHQHILSNESVRNFHEYSYSSAYGGNDFESHISIKFRELREHKHFFDVTLASDDYQIEAQKVILSA